MKKSQLFAVIGFLLGWGAPTGAFILRLLHQGFLTDPVRFLNQDWAQNSFFYWYMMVGTCLVFTGIGYLLGRNEDEDELRHLQKVEEAIRDSLTGLASHRHMHEIFAAKFKRHLDLNRPISCLMIDVDCFDEINETYGYPLGDTVLKDFAQLFRHSIRQADIAARYGGEEFLCIMPDCDESTAGKVAARIRTETEKLVFPLGKTPVKITVSIGSVTVYDVAKSDYRFMIEQSDKNLQEAKRRGRNNTVQTIFDKPHAVSGAAPANR